MSTDYRFKIITKFKEGDKDLGGMRCYSKLWHSKDRINPLKYNSWNFTTTTEWDKPDGLSFWYSVNTTILAETVTFIVGKQ